MSNDHGLGRELHRDRAASIIDYRFNSLARPLGRDFLRITSSAFSLSRSGSQLGSLNELDVTLVDMIDIGEILHATHWDNSHESSADAMFVDIHEHEDDELEESLARSLLIRAVEVQAVRGSSMAMVLGVAAVASPEETSNAVPDLAVDASEVDAGPPNPEQPGHRDAPGTT